MAIVIDGETFHPEEDAGRIINKAPRTLKRYRDNRDGPPFVKLGRSVYYREGALKAWLLAQETVAV